MNTVNQYPISRRSFIKTIAGGAAISFSISSLPISLLAAESPPLTDIAPEPAWAPEPGVAQWRIDGKPKVMGQKIYARDFRARDLAEYGWPYQAEERVMYALRTNRINTVVMDYQLSMLPAELQPITIIDAQKLINDKVDVSCDMKKPFFVCAKNRDKSKNKSNVRHVADYYGQPVALLIFANFDVYRRAKKILQFNQNTIIYGDSVAPLDPSIYGNSYEYVKGSLNGNPFNVVHDEPDYYKSHSPIVKGNITSAIEVNTASGVWQQYSANYVTQVMDPMFMEPEAGLAWYDKQSSRLHLLLGTQSPTGDISGAAEIFRNAKCTYNVSEVDLIACYPGGGFGGRDSSYFTMYLAMAAPYANGYPLRWAQDRFEQFQVGLKRHHTEFTENLCIDDNGLIQAVTASFTLNGGGRKNLSPYVAELAALSVCNAYNIPQIVAYGEALDTPDLIGGSQRGFGGPQAFIALETLLDQAAEDTGRDPFMIRRLNLLDNQSTTVTGAPIQQDLQLPQILDALEALPLWTNRETTKQQFANQGLKYGVGLALANEAYGTGGDGMFGAVMINRDGSITVRTPYIDMGNGAATALGLAPSVWLGKNASNIMMGDAGFFNNLGLTKIDAYPSCVPSETKIDPAKQVAQLSGSSSACLGAFYQYHAVSYAGLSLLLGSVIPALQRLWQAEVDYKQLVFSHGSISIEGYPAIEWSQIVEVIFSQQLPNSAAVHASFVGEFVNADFSFSSLSQNPITLPLDYIALGSLPNALQTVTRTNMTTLPKVNSRYGRSTYAPSGALIAVSVDPNTGYVVVEDCITALSAGVQHCPQLVSGQSQGGVAMAMGYVLSEDCPLSPEGPGAGNWNLDKYKLMKMGNVPLNQQLLVMPPADNEATARGIAEAVMCPIPPAILNALAMATQHRFTQLPVTPAAIRTAI
ncbi:MULTISPECIES: xanthine dehydrogenase family protein molybdopterin-binding subunit [Shewanella]|uniref:Aldehyde oxidase n=1 Tax=Shewanella japonica TaxID=93973 RepID=A0ABM6JJ90_9GAMM|nr:MULTISPECIES: molybdopterin cofactor-binding domain-containing protein [Shewanella]ARD20915.1 Aldehyde oxidase [Shewanella japonica]